MPFKLHWRVIRAVRLTVGWLCGGPALQIVGVVMFVRIRVFFPMTSPLYLWQPLSLYKHFLSDLPVSLPTRPLLGVWLYSYSSFSFPFFLFFSHCGFVSYIPVILPLPPLFHVLLSCAVYHLTPAPPLRFPPTSPSFASPVSSCRVGET